MSDSGLSVASSLDIADVEYRYCGIGCFPEALWKVGGNDRRGKMSQRRAVVQVVANLKQGAGGPAASAESGMRAVLDWLKNKQGLELPVKAYAGESFEIDASEGQPVLVERLDTFWSLQFDRFDGDVPGRIWRTEASIAYSHTVAVAGVRLAVIDASSTVDFVPSVPRVIGDLIRSPGLHEYGADLSDSPVQISTSRGLEAMVRLLENPHRTRPVVVFSEGVGCDAIADARKAAERLAGIGHVFVVREEQSWELTDLLGREFSVWKGAVRTYNPGFNPHVDEITQHPPATREWLKARFGSLDRFYGVLVSTFAARTVRAVGLEEALPNFRTIKQVALEKKIASLASAAKGKTERESLLEQENVLLKQRIIEKIDEFNLADGEVKQVEAERDQYRARLSSLSAKIDALEQRLGEAALQVDYPETFESIDDWALKNFAGRLVLMNRAARAARKSLFNDSELVYRCLERLARGYVDARRAGNPVENLFEDLGVHLERTGDESTLSQWKELYFVPYRTKNEFLTWHLTRGSDKNETNTMRIYFFYDEDDQQVVVGHLPGHLPNSKS